MFFVWGECSFTKSGLHNLRRMRRAGGELVIDHIWAPGAEALRKALDDSGFGSGCGLPDIKMEIQLPTFAEKYPIPSSPLLGEIPRDHIKRSMEYNMRRWRVDALTMEVPDLLELRSAMPCDGAMSPDGCLLSHGVMAGVDFCYVMECVRFSISLLERGYFLPDIETVPWDDGETRYESAWKPILMGEDATRFGNMVKLVPDILRSFDASGEVLSAGEVLRRMTNTIMDGVIRCSWTRKLKNDKDGSHRHLARALVARRTKVQCESAQKERRTRGRLVSALNPHALWVRSLGWLGDTDGLSQSLESIYADVREWRDRFEWLAKAPFKVCLILAAPGADDSAPWRLEYVMRYLRTGVIIPAAEVWRLAGLYAGDIPGDYMRRYLLLMLGIIGSEMPSVLRGLDQEAPVDCAMSMEEASEFIGGRAEDLRGKGVDVIMPKWWGDRPRDELTLRGRLLSGVVSPDMFNDATEAAKGAEEAEEKPRLAFKWELALDGIVLTDEERARVMDGGISLIRIRNRWTFLHPDHLSKIRRRMEALPVEMTAGEAVRIAMKDQHIDGFIDVPELERVYNSLRECSARELLSAPRGMKGTLRPYQTRGYSWMSFLSRLGLGACLADDMGLGKTLQALAMIQHHRDQGDRGPVLIVCPTSVLENWRIEIGRFFPGMSSYLHHGRSRMRGENFVSEINGCDLILTSYVLLQRDIDSYGLVEWQGIVLDEAQNIKNPDTNQARAARSIKARWRIVLTGTPIENHAGDLWSIMEFIMPGMLGSRRAFVNDYVKPIQQERDCVLMENLRRAVSPFILRRMKTDPDIVPDLPQKIETKVYCGLKREQIKLYSNVTSDLGREIGGAVGIRRRGMVLVALTRIKQICDHPSLVTKDDDFTAE
ncbi:MAG: DEAD/DEAH box helicase family protein, partial [Synergistaceae bacterium]|nr:DEAD/DEAH box helicase family protein [Synergistaceae bacterium]